MERVIRCECGYRLFHVCGYDAKVTGLSADAKGNQAGIYIYCRRCKRHNLITITGAEVDG